MGHNSSSVKTSHLGLPYGTAMHKLRKMIIFHMAQRLEEDFCFKCGEQILTVEELSIEHKTPWLHNDVSVFWDMKNIAFSHRKCNLPDRVVKRPPNPGPAGTAWCVGCQEFLDVSDFWKNRSTWNSLQNQCRACMKAYQRTKSTKANHSQSTL